MVRRGFSVLALLLAASACLPNRLEKTESDLKAAIAEAVTRGDTATLRLFIEVPFAFDRLYIAGPRAKESTLAAIMGEEWLPEMSRQIETSDHFYLMIFETRGKIVPAALTMKTVRIDSTLLNRQYTPDNAVFRVEQTSGDPIPTLRPLTSPALPTPAAEPATAPSGSPASPPSGASAP
ncbi:MAG: hypothetical protein IT357_18850 [Gemmatimonadaceae bacterium]|nr:hypothetical protein [Gemmatimonadaceae bacterium]